MKESMSSQRGRQLALADLGINTDTVNWADLGSCSTIDLELITGDGDIFFDLYEKKPGQARATDNICLRCPVIQECFNFGRGNELTGVWGGIYLTRGEIDQARNKHKTQEIIKALANKIYYD
jgi:hypothetical protein